MMSDKIAPKKPPKALLFDIGGVCVGSPFQAILDYELANNIPPGWVNFSISGSAPNGWWHQLERGEIKMDTRFFEGFNQDLCNQQLWRAFYSTRTKIQPGTKNAASVNAVGPDYALPPLPNIDGEFLFWEMMRVSRTPDLFIYPALKKLKASGKFLIAALSNTVIFPPDHPYSQAVVDDIRSQFDVFVSSAHVGLRKPDAQIYLHVVKMMDEYVRDKARNSGAESPLVKELNWNRGITTRDVIFLDDIGENLKTAKKVGMGTIKVQLGKGKDAVKELETVTGLKLLDEDVSRSRL